MWNLWHGCHKVSEGCQHCYVYRGDAKRGLDSTVVAKTKQFDVPVRRKRNGEYSVPSGSLVYTCFTSDFFVEDADPWRAEAWAMMRERNDLRFLIITKRIDRFQQSLPDDWGQGYDHITICCTIENQTRADERLPLYKAAPIKHKVLICEPLLSLIDVSAYDIGSWVEQVVVGGRIGPTGQTLPLRLGAGPPCPLCGEGRVVLVQANRSQLHQRRSAVQHQASIPARSSA